MHSHEDPVAGTALDTSSLSERTYALLRDLIISNQFRPGDRLATADLSRRFGVSSTPVRDALTRLAQDGLVEIRPRSGSFVKVPTKKDLIEIFDLMELLEGLSIRLAAPNMPPAVLHSLRNSMYEAEREVQQGNVEEYMRSDAEFHSALLAHSENERLRRIMSTMETQMAWIRRLLANYLGRPLESARMHSRMCDALVSGNVELAARLMSEHIRDVKQVALSQFDRVFPAGAKLREGRAGSEEKASPRLERPSATSREG